MFYYVQLLSVLRPQAWVLPVCEIKAFRCTVRNSPGCYDLREQNKAHAVKNAVNFPTLLMKEAIYFIIHHVKAAFSKVSQTRQHVGIACCSGY